MHIESDLIMTESRADSELLTELMDRHGLKVDWLSRVTGTCKGHISRMRNGQYPVPYQIFRAIYIKTGDPTIVALFMELDDAPTALPDLLHESSVQACALVAAAARDRTAGKFNAAAIVPNLDSLIRMLLTARCAMDCTVDQVA